MGCTSSAPNMASLTNATDKMTQFSDESRDQSLKDADEVIYRDDGKGINEINVLPSCDTLGEPIQLDRNNKSLLEPLTVESDKDSYANGHIGDCDNIMNKKDELLVEDKLSSLGDVVEKVVELYVVTDNPIEHTQTTANASDEIIPSTENVDKEAVETLEVSQNKVPESDTEQKEQTEPSLELLEEAISPSQSTSSRATRWEALADIAAELPPSLAVDPLTGQIYALSK